MSKIAIITGSNGLIGSECVSFFADKFDTIIGIDNDMRSYFFGYTGSTRKQEDILKKRFSNYNNVNADIRDYKNIEKIFSEYNSDISLVVHTAAQPSHDWAAKEPLTDFGINATGTLNLLELTRLHCPNAVFIFTSTNKVYGDTPNSLPIVELEKRYEVLENSGWYHGIDETMSIDNSKHSLFGASKVAADILVQEYGKYFGMNTGVFRGGCLTGGSHQGTQQHGFLSYLVKCAVEGSSYTIFGFHGKQVRDNIHSYDVANAFYHFYKNPKQGEVYNIGGGRHSNCSILEAIDLIEDVTDKKVIYSVSDNGRSGDHQWYISDMSKFKNDYPEWGYKYSLKKIIKNIYEGCK